MRIDGAAIECNFEMQMWPAGIAGAAHPADSFATIAYEISAGNIKF
jgi:hypothetical protein